MTAATAASTAAPTRTPSGSRLTGWVNGWRVALRIARRDAWKHKGRSLLVLVMISIPVLVMSGALTLIATNDVNEVEGIPARMGSAQAVVEGFSTQQERQTPAADQGGMSCPDGSACPAARTLPGKVTGASPASDVATSLESLLHASVSPMSAYSMTARIDGRIRSLDVIGADASRPVFRGMVELASGRWPRTATEVVVTDVGLRRGLPDHGALTLTAPPEGPYFAGQAVVPATGAVTVVGTARATATRPADVVRLVEGTVPASSLQFLVDRRAPMTWADVKEANTYGLLVASRAVIQDPPPVAEQYPSDENYYRGNDETLLLAIVLAALFAVSALLAGPAFAVIAQRQRRTLALAASNGATGAQLRRAMLGQAVVLGALGTVVATASGVALSPVVSAVYSRVNPRHVSGPFDIPWLQLLVVMGCASLSAVVAAVLPARGLGRLDVIGTLRGDVAPRRPIRWLPALGIALFAGGGIAIWYVFFRLVTSHHRTDDGTAATALIIGGCALLVVGALLTVPMALVAVGRLAGTAPVPVRLAARDAARQRGRTAPTVAAVMAGAILLSGVGIIAGSYDAQGLRTYTPHAPMGVSSVDIDGWPGEAARDEAEMLGAVRAVLPGARTVTFAVAAAQPPRTDSGQPSTSVALVPHGMTVGSALWGDDERAATAPNVVAGESTGAQTSRLVVVDPAALERVVGAMPDVRAALLRGEVVTTTGLPSGTVDVRRLDEPGVTEDAGSTEGAGPTERVVGQATVYRVSGGPLAGIEGYASLALATTETARRLGAPVLTPHRIWFRAAAPLTDEQRDAIGERVPDTLSASSIRTERGYESPFATLLTMLLVGITLLVLIATVTATALSIGEAQRDLAVLAAVGARDRVRRCLAAAQAGVLALVGTLLGLVVGGVPGVLYALYVTNAVEDSPSISWQDLTIPWPTLLTALVLVPLLAAGVAALVVRGRPDLTRRRAV